MGAAGLRHRRQIIVVNVFEFPESASLFPGKDVQGQSGFYPRPSGTVVPFHNTGQIVVNHHFPGARPSDRNMSGTNCYGFHC